MRVPTVLWLAALTLPLLAKAQDDVMEALEIETNPETCLVKDYANYMDGLIGAKGDGKSLDTAAIQKALDDCAKKREGGIVLFEEGKTYVSGSLNLPSQTAISLPKKTVLKASLDRQHYPKSMSDWYFLRIDKATRVSVQGPGQINGQAQDWTEKYAGKKQLRSWPEEACMDSDACRPNLIAIRDSSQVNIQGIELKDFTGIAIHAQRSEATAIIDCKLYADRALEGPQGIVVDGGKRVFIGKTIVETPGHSITAVVSAGKKGLESLLVDGIELKSSTTAFQIGPEAAAEMKNIVVQNVKILESKRGIGLQLYDAGSIHDVWFTNVTIKAQHMDGNAVGSAEAIFVSVEAESYGSAIGKMSSIWFGRIKAEAESGVIFSGDHRSTIDGITLKGSTLKLKKLSNVAASFRDYRPALSGYFEVEDVPAIFLEYANHVQFNDVQVTFESGGRPEWSDLLQITPRSVHALSLTEFAMHDAAAHPTSDSYSPMKAFTQLGDFFRHSYQDFANTVSKRGFISMQENAATGVIGRKAASSGSPIIIVLLMLVLFAIIFYFACLPIIRSLRREREKSIV